MQEHPELLADVMKAMEMRLDHARVVSMMRREKALPLIKDYLLNVQKANLLEVRYDICGWRWMHSMMGLLGNHTLSSTCKPYISKGTPAGTEKELPAWRLCYSCTCSSKYPGLAVPKCLTASV
jgi:hypothetical protein